MCRENFRSLNSIISFDLIVLETFKPIFCIRVALATPREILPRFGNVGLRATPTLQRFSVLFRPSDCADPTYPLNFPCFRSCVLVLLPPLQTDLIFILLLLPSSAFLVGHFLPNIAEILSGIVI
jgi:hypothetical protein